MRGRVSVIVPVVLVLAATLVFALREAEHPARADLRVRATVARTVRVSLLQVPEVLVITPEHVQQGEVDVAGPTMLSVHGNAPDTATLQVGLDTGLVSSVLVTGLPRPAGWLADGSIVQLPGLRGDTRLELRWKLRLSAQARPGTYPWPVRLQVEAS